MAKGTFSVGAIAIEPIITVSWVDPCYFAMPILAFTSLKGGGGQKSNKIDISSGGLS